MNTMHYEIRLLIVGRRMARRGRERRLGARVKLAGDPAAEQATRAPEGLFLFPSDQNNKRGYGTPDVCPSIPVELCWRRDVTRAVQNGSREQK